MRRTLSTLAVGLLTASLALPAGAADDPLLSEQWGLSQIRATTAWSTTTGGGSVVAVLDSGVDLDHPDLRANVVTGRDFTGVNGNGDWDPDRDGVGEAHGTHVAGIVAAAAGNGTGIAGVAPDATILPVRVLDDEGSGSDADIADGIRYAVDRGADVINLSLGSLPGFETLDRFGIYPDIPDAVEYATSRGVLVVAAAGNDSYPLCASPSNADGVLCVTATDELGAPAWYSNHAVKDDLLAVAAPGGQGTTCGAGVYSTVPAEAGTSCGPTGYDSYDGTSMATPHVAGVAALLYALGCDRTQTIDLLVTTASSPAGVWDPVYGHGIVDATAAVAAADGTCAGGGTGGGGGDTGDTGGTGGNGGGKDKPKGGGSNGKGNGGRSVALRLPTASHVAV